MPPKNKSILSVEHLNMLNSALSEAGSSNCEVDNSNMNSLISSLLVAFLYVKKRLDDLEGSSSGLQVNPQTKQKEDSDMNKKCQALEDELDEVQQRSFKGNLILTSKDIPANPRMGRPASKSVIKSDEELGDQTLLDHVLGLVKAKYQVEVPQSDIQACHRLPHGAVLLRIWNRKYGSAWSRLVSSIKSRPKNPQLNFYANFHLTQKRRNLNYFVRQLKRTENISQFYTDENGAISIKVGNMKKMVTFHREGKSRDAVLTMTEEEIKSFIITVGH